MATREPAHAVAARCGAGFSPSPSRGRPGWGWVSAGFAATLGKPIPTQPSPCRGGLQVAGVAGGSGSIRVPPPPEPIMSRLLLPAFVAIALACSACGPTPPPSQPLSEARRVGTGEYV